MSDAELICARMEEKPTARMDSQYADQPKWWIWGWWYTEPSQPNVERPVAYGWKPRSMTLDALHRVESELTEGQWPYYMAELLPKEFVPPFPLTAFQAVTHATAEQKIKALAAVFRGVSK